MGAGGACLRRDAELRRKQVDDLRALYPEPAGLAVAKQLDRVDAHAARFIARSPFMVMATADAAGNCDASPRGDAPGFVEVADAHTLLVPDRPGNNRVDSLANIASNPRVGLLFFVPGVLETLRVNGRAELTADPARLASLAAAGRVPRSALVVTVEEVFFHCGKALKRSALWDPARYAEPGEIPSLGRILADQVGGVDARDAEARIETAYRDKLY
jgi:PPOX class probable FMN-dependent enzyme